MFPRTISVDHDPNASLSCAFTWKPLNCRLNCDNCYSDVFSGVGHGDLGTSRKAAGSSGYIHTHLNLWWLFDGLIRKEIPTSASMRLLLPRKRLHAGIGIFLLSISCVSQLR